MKNSKELEETYTLGIWTVKPGKEEEFIRIWTSFANWTSENISGAGKGRLLLDEKNSLRFISFGPWNSEDSIQKWRDSGEFKSFVTKAKDLCDDFQPNTLKLVSTSD
jgi:heme-degrading monooxygenase HmoA